MESNNRASITLGRMFQDAQTTSYQKAGNAIGAVGAPHHKAQEERGRGRLVTIGLSDVGFLPGFGLRHAP